VHVLKGVKCYLAAAKQQQVKKENQAHHKKSKRIISDIQKKNMTHQNDVQVTRYTYPEYTR
jgi:hypothetical protein